MIQKPPKWQKKLSIELLQRALKSDEMKELVKKANGDYAYWDKFRHYKMPKGFTEEESWAYLKFSRNSLQEKIPAKSEDGTYFTFVPLKSLYQKLNYIDTHGAGFIKTLNTNPSESQKTRLIMGSLTEEAIATSQIEGANTSKKVAKEMILSQRKPQTESEQMIINSYKLMQQLEVWEDVDLSEKLLLEMQTIITDQTVEEDDRGRFRSADDDIVVSDAITGEIAHKPMNHIGMRKELRHLIAFANKNESDEDFMHPVIKATILHFWLSYLHPFVDGNGRTARGIFYWYLQKKGYWLIKYISVSRAIASSKKRYDRSFIESELDENDMTYFMLYIAKAFEDSIKFFVDDLGKKFAKEELYRKIAHNLKKFNERQISLLKYFQKNPSTQVDVEMHKNKHIISRVTAHIDLHELEKKNLIIGTKKGKKKIYLANKKEIDKIFKK